MGFDQTQCLQAINAAKGSVQIAIEYLYNGIPPNLGYEDNGIINQDNINENADYEEDEEDLYIPPEVLDTINLEDPNALSNIASVLKVLISSSPQSLQNILEEVEDTNPEIIDFIKQNETEFKLMMSQPVNEDDRNVFKTAILGVVGNNNQPNNVPHDNNYQEEESLEDLDNMTKDFTDKDRESITNLVNLGFTEIDAIQAYVACGKNEAFAADFLFQDKN
jgi:UV excision repair protein RAD23